jgi:endonuclease/exonuclease/phosphatase family metal-dependent hydrolase
MKLNFMPAIQKSFESPQQNAYRAGMFFRYAHAGVCLIAIVFGLQTGAAEVFRVATYNVENYLDQRSGTRPAKSAEGRAKVCESIVALKPDVLALQEIGATNTLLELQSSLKTRGIDLPYWEYITGFDTNIHVAVLSRFPIIARHPLTNDNFLLNGSSYRVSRGFAQLDLQINPATVVTLIAVHLKSKRPIPQVSEADLRLAEA